MTAGATAAQELFSNWTGEFSSSKLLAIPAKPVFDVVIYDDTEQNLAFRKEFLAALRKAGYRTSDKAPFEFSFATSITWRERRIREYERQQRRQHPVDIEEATFPDRFDPVYGNEPGSRLFGDRRTRAPRTLPSISNADQDRLDISVELRDRKSGEIVWTADLALPLLEFDRPRITRSIVGPIIKAVGRNVIREQFDVR